MVILNNISFIYKTYTNRNNMSNEISNFMLFDDLRKIIEESKKQLLIT